MVANGGRPLSGPKIQPDGNLLLQYTDGENCVDTDNTSRPFSVSVFLHCAATDEVCLHFAVSLLNVAVSFRFETLLYSPVIV